MHKKIPKKLHTGIVKDVFPPEELFNSLRNRRTHRRLGVFYYKGVKCCYCDIKGTYLIRCIDKFGNEHIDLYTEDFKLMNVDHIVPKSRGGKKVLHNLVPSCYKCNSKKGNKPSWYHTFCVWKLHLKLLFSIRYYA